MPSPGSVIPTDTIIAPLVAQLILVAQQIQGVGTCYPEAPEGAPEDNSVLFPTKDIRVKDATNGRLSFEITFEVMHCFRRSRLPDTLARLYTFLPAWWTVLADWANLTLGGLASDMSLERTQISEVTHGGQTMLALIHTVTVRTEFLIPLT